MALSLIPAEAKLKADQMIPGADSDTFQNLAGVAKSNCPVSKLLKADVSLDAELVT
jgi:osmotically inducible protein OsmC